MTTTKYEIGDVVYFYDYGVGKIIAGMVKCIDVGDAMFTPPDVDSDWLYTCMISDDSLRYIWGAELDDIQSNLDILEEL